MRLDRPAGHIAFSHGVHYCLGAPLARMEADVAIRTLLTRVWRISLAVPETELQWRPGLLMHGLQRLPVSFELDERQPPANFITPTQGPD